MPRQRSVGEAVEPLVGNYFVSAYPPFSCWTTAGAERFRAALHERASDAPFGLYVHVPFCVERCQYCYYLAHDDRRGEIDRYLDSLVRELELYALTPALADRPIGFVYFGGGTPSLLSTARIRRLLERLQHVFPWTQAHEVTFECAPKTVTDAKLRTLRKAGVTRLSLGVQQLDDGVLRKNGRVHLVADVESAYEAVQRVGFDVVNVDLIVGLVAETDVTFGRSLERVIELGPPSVTLYQLEIPRNTPLYRRLSAGALEAPPASWELKRRRLAQAFERLERAGYTVTSAYQALRDPAAHRFVYQEEQYRGADLLGIGVSAFSYLGGIHQQNLAAMDRYLAALAQPELPLGRGYALNEDERLVRELVLQLKLGRVDLGALGEKFGVDVAGRFAEPLASLSAAGWARRDAERIELTREGLLRADRLLAAFYQSQHRGVRYS